MSVNGTLEPVQTLTGSASASPYIPERMAHKLTFTGAVEAEYDGSGAVEVKIPNGGGAVTPEEVAAAVEAYMEEHPVEVTESDPTVPAWAKAESKPTYTAAEVGALPDTYTAPVSSVNGQTGTVVLNAEDVGALPDTTQIPAVPAALPNPYKLTFTGAVSAEYDGSKAVSVEIPSGGGGGESEWALLADITTEEDVASITVDVPEGYRELFVKGCGYFVPDGSGYAFLKINNTTPGNGGVIAEANNVWFFHNNKRTMCCHVQRAGNNLVSNFNNQTFNPPVAGVVRGMISNSSIGLFEDFGEDSAIETVTLSAQSTQFLAGFRFTVWGK